MLTPQEVSERVFPKASFGGYNMAQVDEFLDLLTEDYGTLYSENAVLKSKMKVLVDKVEEYRSTENAMRKALMAAQRMADDTMKEAEEKRDQILRQAETQAQQQVADIRSQRQDEEFRLAAAQKATADYVEQVKALHGQALDYLNALDQLTPTQSDQPQSADQVEEAVSDIDESVQRLLAQAMDDVAAETAQQETPAAPQEQEEDTIPLPTAEQMEQAQEQEQPPAGRPSGSRIDFGALQFGRDYEIK